MFIVKTTTESQELSCLGFVLYAKDFESAYDFRNSSFDNYNIQLKKILVHYFSITKLYFYKLLHIVNLKNKFI